MAELGHSDLLSIYVDPSKSFVDPGILVNSNELFSETDALMVLKFQIQHEEVAGLQTDKIQPG